MLGQGTFGKVVEARDIQTGQHVAVKVIRAIQKYRDASKIEVRAKRYVPQLGLRLTAFVVICVSLHPTAAADGRATARFPVLCLVKRWARP